ncbi:MAG: ammonium transporter [Polyangiaceae bacterium]
MRNRIGLALVALAVALSAVSWSQAAFADEAAAAPAAEAPAEAKKKMTWEEFQEKTGIVDDDSLEASPLGNKGGYPVNYVWTVVAAILVFWMQAGFALVEAGFTRAKNTVNIMMKNLMDFVLGSLAFWAIGFGLMFGVTNGFCGTTGFFLSGYGDDTWTYAFLLFQTVFAATAATIVSGAMAERTKFTSYLIYSVVISALIYPIFGSWAWGGLFKGGGWLQAPEGGFLASHGLPGFIDFAGSTVVHSIGGWAALAGAIVIGPRIGKFDSKGRALPIRGHNMALATLGVFILWMGWFGFNPGSTTAATGGGADAFGGIGKAFPLIAVNTNLSGCAGGAAALIVTWALTKKPDIGMSLNGVLAGLVAITAPCANVTPASSVVIGLIGGVLVVFAVQFFDKIKIDDPVGAVSVHGVCGAWGTLSAAIFNHGGFTGAQLATQALGVLAAFLWSFGLAFILFKVLKATVGLRVSAEEEIEGLDITEHGNEAYPQEIGGGHGINPEVAEAAGLKAAEAEA